MRVFIPENWESLRNELSKFGKVVEVKKGDYEEYCCAVVGRSLKVSAEQRNLREVLECLADLGFDFAALTGFELEVSGLEKGMGIKIPKVKSVEEALRAPNIETLKSLIEKLKRTEFADECGAIGIFVGFVRKKSDGKVIRNLEYEAYEDVLEEKIGEIKERVEKSGVKVEIYHKRGIIMPREDIVYVAVMGKHRNDVWGPLKDTVELIKKELPIWKKEVFENGEIWVHDKEKS